MRSSSLEKPLTFYGAPTDVREGSAVVAECRNLLFERGIDLWHEATRFWCNRFGSMVTCDIRQQAIANAVPPPDTRSRVLISWMS